jgi:hypothetical protein
MALVSTDVDDKIKGMTGPKGEQKLAGKKVGKKVAKFSSAKGGKK